MLEMKSVVLGEKIFGFLNRLFHLGGNLCL